VVDPFRKIAVVVQSLSVLSGVMPLPTWSEFDPHIHSSHHILIDDFISDLILRIKNSFLWASM
jgi:hypothetical protein